MIQLVVRTEIVTMNTEPTAPLPVVVRVGTTRVVRLVTTATADTGVHLMTPTVANTSGFRTMSSPDPSTA